MEAPERLPFVFQTHTGSPTGYAETACLLFRSLLEEGVEVHYVSLSDDYIYEAPSYELVVNHYRKCEPENEPVWVTYATVPLFFNNGGKYRVGYSMIETDKICERWVRIANRMDEIWVPTQMNKEAFVAAGVQVPVRVVPLGIDAAHFKPSFTPAIYHGDHKFRFFCSAFWQQRKRWDMLIQAFSEEFGNEKEVGLICKCISEQPTEEIADQIHSWVGHKVDDQIAVVEGGYPWWEYVSMMRACQAFVLPTAGEGWGCPPVQALACGLPVIVTDCMGCGEVLKDEAGIAFPGVRFLPAVMEPSKVEHEYYAGSNWWTPDAKDLRAAMREVYVNYQKWQGEALKGSQMVRELRSGTVAALSVRKELKRIYEEL